jgi:hypothetical protein
VWLNNALLNFDSTRIEYTDFKTLKITNDSKFFTILQIVNAGDKQNLFLQLIIQVYC